MTPRHIRIAVCAALFCFACLNTRIAAQERQAADRYLVSAKAGVVNLVEGRAEVRGAGVWRAATTKDVMRSGDAARTSADARLEVLLTPGSFLRLGADAEIEMTDASLERLTLRLHRGGAIVEAVDAGDDAPVVTITTPHTTIAIVRGGVYRIEADAAASELVVHKGRALVGGASLLVKGKRKTTIAANGAASAPAKFDKKQERDDFDLWSRERAEQLARENRRLSQRALSTTLASYSAFRDPFFAGNNRSGLWVFNEISGGHTYLPFGWGRRSPYGCNYNTGMMPGNQHTGFNPIVGNRPPYTPNEGGGNIGGSPVGNNGSGNNAGNIGVAQPNNPAPREPTQRDMPSERPQYRPGRQMPIID